MTESEAYELGFRMGRGTATDVDAEVTPPEPLMPEYIRGYEDGRVDRMAEEAKALGLGFVEDVDA